ncbi:hypothetical protein K466DRAFT_343547 [Polyporus arcularius HHB13444]|uniref:Uncharacterized protein n=1 Tax=Polyporus arcularius HHB13444 TaxID=1314778 RepID=A0A5C3NVI7_9APHY|nr:hypothetical protein K466DRAFT_343547 [Polyporus arcularius HHB13444]
MTPRNTVTCRTQYLRPQYRGGQSLRRRALALAGSVDWYLQANAMEGDRRRPQTSRFSKRDTARTLWIERATRRRRTRRDRSWSLSLFRASRLAEFHGRGGGSGVSGPGCRRPERVLQQGTGNAARRGERGGSAGFQLPAARFWGGRRGEVKVSRTSTPSTEGPGAAVSVDSVSRSSQSENPDPECCVHMVSLVVRYVPVMIHSSTQVPLRPCPRLDPRDLRPWPYLRLPGTVTVGGALSTTSTYLALTARCPSRVPGAWGIRQELGPRDCVSSLHCAGLLIGAGAGAAGGEERVRDGRSAVTTVGPDSDLDVARSPGRVCKACAGTGCDLRLATCETRARSSLSMQEL